MTSLTLAALVQFSVLMAGSGEANVTYAAAHRETADTGKPLMVMVSTEWCPPCQQMKKNIMPQVRERGLLGKVAFAMVNPDVDRELAQQISGGGPIPQLVMFRKTRAGWIRNKLIGGQSVETVEKFINDAVQANEQPQEQTAAVAPPTTE